MLSNKCTMEKEEKSTWMRAIVELQVESGLSVPAFCLREGIKEHILYYWRRKYHKELEGKEDSVGFSEIRIKEPSSEVLLALGGGFRVGLSGMSIEELASLLLALERGRHA